MPELTLEIVPVLSREFGQNAYVAWPRGGSEAVVVDPGFDLPAVEAVLKREGLKVAAILNTHGHADHIAGNAGLKGAHPDAPLVIGRGDAHLLTDPEANLSAGFGLAITSPPADRLVEHGERFEAAGVTWEVREIPGHSPGSVVFLALDFEPPIAIVGDVLFSGSVGRTDFPGGSAETLFEGIRRHLYGLPDPTRVYPGHGPPTTIGAERRGNPFVRDP